MQALKYVLRIGSSRVLVPGLMPKGFCRNYQKIARGLLFRSAIKIHGSYTQQPCFCTSTYQNQDDQEEPDSELDTMLNDANHNQFIRTIYSIPGAGHRIFFIQPHVKKGPNRVHTTMMQYSMDESITLIETLDNWKVVDKLILATANPARKHVFGSGNTEKLRSLVCTNCSVSAAFINVNKLSGMQRAALEKLLGLPIFDRYSIVLQIFKDHAKTRIAKLQVALAEIPYVRSMLKWVNLDGGDKEQIWGAGETPLEIQTRHLLEREAKLNNALKKHRTHRQLIRKNRGRQDIAVVAVVGYTNSGKTSLIKALTGDKSLVPVNQLFATLDVTAHGGHLLNRMPAIFVDTVGFISDIPTALIESFQSTLEDIAQADLIVHIRDISHPNTNGQRKCVLETLNQLDLSNELFENIIEIGNKMDLIQESDSRQDHGQCLLVSVTKGKGLAELQNLIEEKLIDCTSNQKRVFRVPNGGDEYRWLYKEAAVSSVIPDDDDDQYLLMKVIIGKAAFSKFCHYFGDLELTTDDK